MAIGNPSKRTSHRSRWGVFSHRCLRKASAADTVSTGPEGSAGIADRKALEMIKAQEPVAIHNEAPCSVNVRLPLGGREIQLTLRDSDEKRLLMRLTDVLIQFQQDAPRVDHESHQN